MPEAGQQGNPGVGPDVLPAQDSIGCPAKPGITAHAMFFWRQNPQAEEGTQERTGGIEAAAQITVKSDMVMNRHFFHGIICSSVAASIDLTLYLFLLDLP